MSMNWVRIFRRAGWVVTLPVTTLIVLGSYEHIQTWVIELPDTGTVIYSGTIPAGAWDVLKASSTKEELRASVEKLPLPEEVKAILSKRLAEHKLAGSWFAAHTNVSKLRLFGLVVGSLAAVSLLIQGSISVSPWIWRKFCSSGGDKVAIGTRSAASRPGPPMS